MPTAAGTYGRPRLHHMLARRGYRVSAKRIARLMRDARLVARGRRRGCRTTVSDPAARAANVLGRQFQVGRVNTVWAADITALPTIEGWCYLAVVLDLASRRIVGWATRATLDAELAAWRLTRRDGHAGGPARAAPSFRSRRPVHQRRLWRVTDAGWLPREHESRRQLLGQRACRKLLQLAQSRSAAGPDLADARRAIAAYVRFYNERRLHSSLGFQSPQEYEAQVAAVV